MDTRKATSGLVPLRELSLDLANLRTHIEWLESGAAPDFSADEELGKVAVALWAIEEKICSLRGPFNMAAYSD